jgi:hypothetical protein
MAAGPVELVAGVVIAASALTASALPGPVPAAPRPAQPVPCAEPAAWEADAQRLADALDGVTGDADADRLRDRLGTAGFVAGDGSTGRGEGDVADLVTDLLAALTGAGGDGRVDAAVIVVGPDGEATEVAPDGACTPGGS